MPRSNLDVRLDLALAGWAIVLATLVGGSACHQSDVGGDGPGGEQWTLGDAAGADDAGGSSAESDGAGSDDTAASGGDTVPSTEQDTVSPADRQCEMGELVDPKTHPGCPPPPENSDKEFYGGHRVLNPETGCCCEYLREVPDELDEDGIHLCSE